MINYLNVPMVNLKLKLRNVLQLKIATPVALEWLPSIHHLRRMMGDITHPKGQCAQACVLARTAFPSVGSWWGETPPYAPPE